MSAVKSRKNYTQLVRGEQWLGLDEIESMRSVSKSAQMINWWRGRVIAYGKNLNNLNNAADGNKLWKRG